MKKIFFSSLVLLAVACAFAFKEKDKPLCTTPSNNTTQNSAINLCPGISYTNITFNGQVTANGSGDYAFTQSRFKGGLVVSGLSGIFGFYPDLFPVDTRSLSGSISVSSADFQPECYGLPVKLTGSFTVGNKGTVFVDASRFEITGNLTVNGTSGNPAYFECDTLIVGGTMSHNTYGTIVYNVKL